MHVHPDAGELGRVYRPTLAINACPGAFAEAFAAAKAGEAPAWAADTAKLHGSYLAWSTPPETGPGAVQMGPIMDWLETVLPRRRDRHQRRRQLRDLAAPLPPLSPLRHAGCADLGLDGLRHAGRGRRQRLFPDRLVVAFAGDGCFLMNGQEFATAVQYGLPIIVIVVNNGIYGTIRMHQEREFPGPRHRHRPEESGFRRPCPRLWRPWRDRRTTADFAPAFERARASGKPAIIEIRLDPEAITPTRSLTDIRERR